MSIFPYIYFMIEDFHITEDANKIAIYAGMVTSAFTFAEFLTGVLWGKNSDKRGRKPVLMFCTRLTGVSLTGGSPPPCMLVNGFIGWLSWLGPIDHDCPARPLWS